MNKKKKKQKKKKKKKKVQEGTIGHYMGRFLRTNICIFTVHPSPIDVCADFKPYSVHLFLCCRYSLSVQSSPK